MPQVKIDHLRRLKADAERWRKLVKLVGTPANASDATVKLSIDDATMTAFICVDKTVYHDENYTDSIDSVMDSIPMPED